MAVERPKVLIVADKEDLPFLAQEREREHWDLRWKVVEYGKLLGKGREIGDCIAQEGVDFPLFSRNDQVAGRVRIGRLIRELGTGYSSFSGIDDIDRREQMEACFEDFLSCDRRLELEVGGKDETRGGTSAERTFSLIFDTEQLGGARFGLPRILKLLHQYNVRATFFVTNLMKKVYGNVVEGLRGAGHEVGLHGRWHEFMAPLSREDQGKAIAAMREDLGGGIYGANFIGRMNQDTILALIDNGIEYFVHPWINYYRLFHYPKLPTSPWLVSLPEGKIWLLPISVETYGLPWFSVRNMVDSALGLKGGFPHVSILLHPFRDGNLRHIGALEKMIAYLLQRGLVPLTLGELAEGLPERGAFRVLQDCVMDSIVKKGWRGYFPRSRADLLGLVPENLMLLWKGIRRGKAVF